MHLSTITTSESLDKISYNNSHSIKTKYLSAKERLGVDILDLFFFYYENLPPLIQIQDGSKIPKPCCDPLHAQELQGARRLEGGGGIPVSFSKSFTFTHF